MGQPQEFQISNALGTCVKLTNVGAAIMDIILADKDGELRSVIAGFEHAEQYLAEAYQRTNLCLGATVGRVAGRISGGGFTLDGHFYPLVQNQGQHLHSEHCGFQHQLWQAKQLSAAAIQFDLIQDECCGYPGKLRVSALYELSEDNELSLTYRAKTDRPTVVNMCNHTYFNLNGDGSVLDHQLSIPAARFLETDDNIIPTGILLNVEENGLDFRKPVKLADQLGKGLDHAFQLSEDAPITLYAPKTGIGLKITTNQPAVVVYTPSEFKGLQLSNDSYAYYPAICLEMQGFPDAANHQNFPSIRLEPGQEYLNTSTYAFYVD